MSGVTWKRAGQSEASLSSVATLTTTLNGAKLWTASGAAGVVENGTSPSPESVNSEVVSRFVPQPVVVIVTDCAALTPLASVATTATRYCPLASGTKVGDA